MKAIINLIIYVFTWVGLFWLFVFVFFPIGSVVANTLTTKLQNYINEPEPPKPLSYNPKNEYFDCRIRPRPQTAMKGDYF